MSGPTVLRLNPTSGLLLALLVAPTTAAMVGCAAGDRSKSTLLGYVVHVPPEPNEQRAWRQRMVAERRARLPIIVHRGAWKEAPENTLEAYAAAMDLGADGVEIDIRRTADGVLYLFHDADLDRLTNGTGSVRSFSYFELLQLTPKEVYGRATRQTRPPTFAAFLILARRRAMLIHLDIKEPGLEEDIEQLLHAADVWDHVVHINDYNADTLRANSRFRPLAYAGWVPKDAAPDEIRRFCERAHSQGAMVFCDDPEPAIRAIGRPVPGPVPLPDGIRAEWLATGIAGPESTMRNTGRRDGAEADHRRRRDATEMQQ
jgi:glycerophosphoryl diester phosphodiesterase